MSLYDSSSDGESSQVIPLTFPAWLYRTFFVRTNAYAKYDPNGVPSRIAAPIDSSTIKAHVAGVAPIGAYTTDPEDDCCLWGSLDPDWHGEGVPPAGNLQFALAMYQQLRSLGFDPILEDSNGKGGYHLWYLFSEKVPAVTLLSFGQWLVKDHEAYQISRPEVFPKQGSVRGRYGNQMRLPGKHPKRTHWSRIWDGTTWLEWSDAKEYMIGRQKATASMIPAEALAYIPPATVRAGVVPSSALWEDYNSADWPKNYDGDLKTLDIVQLFDNDGMLRDMVGGQQEVLCPWHDDHTTGDQGTAVWEATDGKYPGFNCLHSHCQGKTIEDVLAWFGKDKVDACCTSLFRADPDALRPEELQAVERVVKEYTPEQLAELPLGQPEDKYTTWETEKKRNRKRRGYRLDDLERLPPVQYLVQSHFTTDSTVLLFGPPGSFKSFIGIDLALSVASGTPFLGTYPVRQGATVYLSGEGNSGITRRIKAWLQHHSRSYPDNSVFVPFAFDLLYDQDVSEVVDIIREDLGERPSLIVIDTLARNFGSGDENATRDMSTFIRNLDAIRRAFPGATIVIIHHSGKDLTKGERGNTALRAAVDTAICCDPSEDGKTVLLDCRKQKDGERFESYMLSRVVVPLGTDSEGEDISSCVMIPQDQTRTKYQLLPRAKKQYLQTLWDTFGGNSFTPADAEKAARFSRSTHTDNLRYITSHGLLTNDKGRYTIIHGIRTVLMGAGKHV